eukprot:COSAG04_NODE_3057_length_3225_cov_1.581254_1_plen_137_part_00
MTYISRLAIFDILGIRNITALRPRLIHAFVQNVLVAAVCTWSAKSGISLGFFIGLLGCSACVLVQLFFPGLMAIRMGYVKVGWALLVLSALQFVVGMFVTISAQLCLLGDVSTSFCDRLGAPSPAGAGSAADLGVR